MTLEFIEGAKVTWLDLCFWKTTLAAERRGKESSIMTTQEGNAFQEEKRASSVRCHKEVE